MLRAGALGDVVLGLPALRALRRRFPRAEITLVAPLPQARTALWEPVVDRVVDFGEPALAPLIDGSAAEAPAVLPLGDAGVVWLRGHRGVEVTLRRLGVTRTVGCAPLDGAGRRVHVAAWLEQSLAPLGVAPGGGVGRLASPAVGNDGVGGIVLHPGSGSARKNWRDWPKVVRSLEPERLTVLAGPADAQPLASLLGDWPSGAPRPDVRADLTLERLAAYLAGASLYLGNDSGVSHLAGSLGTATVAVFGPTDPEIWRPVGPRVVALGGLPVERGVFAEAAAWPSVDEVVEAARRLLAQAS